MKILWTGYFGKNHSWAHCARNISQCLIDNGHELHVNSTDGNERVSKELLHTIKNIVPNNFQELNQDKFDKVFYKNLDENYDCQLSYTAPKNFYKYLGRGNKNRFGIWCYEWAGKNVLPANFAKSHIFSDAILAPSKFAKQIFVDSGVPESKVKVLSHGVSSNYEKDSKISLPTNKSFKILANIAQNHKRKNISGLLESYGKAFSKKDDVCLLLKSNIKVSKTNYPFDIDLKEEINKFKSKYPNHAELKLYTEYVDDLSSLYRSVDCTFTMAHCEGFWMPGIESLASGKLAIAPNWGGQIDFLNNDNSLLVSGKEVRADPSSMYWESKNNAIWFKPDIDDAVDKLRFAEKNHKEMNSLLENNRSTFYDKYSWQSITKQIESFCV